MKYLSLFSGIGGFELGITQAYERMRTQNKEEGVQGTGSPQGQSGECHNLSSNGLTCIGYSEIDKYAIQIYEKHFNHKNYGDITKIDETSLPDFDLLVGGFPCQAFSIAGKRGGFEDTRGTMFFEIVRIIREKQPRLLLLENVKGLLSHDKGRTFYTIISTLNELGYDLQWQVLNSKNHGVPQNRERVFIIGHLRGTPRPEVFPFTESSRVYDAQETAKCLTATNYKGIGNDGTTCIFDDYNGNWRKDKISCTLTPNTGSKSKRNGQKVDDGFQIRRLTPTECERLQGFPDGWTEGVSDTQRYKTLGNAVTVNVVSDIMTCKI